MSRRARLAVLGVAIGVAGLAGAGGGAADGCPPSTCGTLSLAPPGSPLVMVLPWGVSGSLEAYDAVTGKKRFALGSGRLSPDGTWYFAIRNRKKDTLIRRVDASTGRPVGAWAMAGHNWWIGATSPGGRHVVLTAFTKPKHAKFAIVDGRTGALERTIELVGWWEPETVSRDGQRLYLIQHLRGGQEYRIRLYDVAHARLVGGAIRPRNETEAMAGYPWNAIATPDGRWLLTLYIRPFGHEAFVHALDLDHAVAYCLDLPGKGQAQALQQYALSLSRDGRTLYAANGAIGSVARLNLESLRVTSLASFRGVKAGRAQWGSAAMSPDERTLYFGGVAGLWAYHGSTGVVRGPYHVGRIAGFGFTPDGKRLTVIRFGARPVALEAATGRMLAGS